MKLLLKEKIRINSKAAFFILKAGAVNVQEGGKLITIVTSLLAAFTGYYTSYAGSKAPVEHFTRGVSKELMSKRVSVNAIAPGPMDTRKSLFFFIFTFHSPFFQFVV
jgi:NAD(P)-dependent dehydrogenase (short-subunit alcohol dehydrogenase family)